MTRTTSLLFLTGLIIMASLALYRTSTRVQELDRELRGLNAAIETERENMHVLKAEWVYLANPSRVEAEAQKYLGMAPTKPRQVATLSDFAGLLHDRNEAVAEAGPKPAEKPLASIQSRLKLALAAPAAERSTSGHHRTAAHEVTVADAGTGYFTDHMTMQRSGAAQPDAIGAMIERMDAGAPR